MQIRAGSGRSGDGAETGAREARAAIATEVAVLHGDDVMPANFCFPLCLHFPRPHCIAFAACMHSILPFRGRMTLGFGLRLLIYGSHV